MKYLVMLLCFLFLSLMLFYGCGGGASTQQGSVDEDNDGMLDVWELQYFASIEECNPDDDSDGDTKTNLEEFLDRTDPTRAVSVDLDGDGIDDEWELIYFSTIAECNPNEDPDGDGLTNLQEYQGGSDPTDRQDPYADPEPVQPFEIPAPTQTRYIDNTIGVDSTNSYNPSNRSASGGSETAYRTFAGACAAASPGMKFIIRAGTYNEQLIPTVSGNSNNYIWFKAKDGEVVTIAGAALDPGIKVGNDNAKCENSDGDFGIDYLVFDGIHIQNTWKLFWVFHSRNVIVQNCTFRDYAGGGGSISTMYFYHCDYCIFRYNDIDNSDTGAGDHVVFEFTDHSMISNNVMRRGGHAQIAIRASSFNIIKENDLDNSVQKIIEVYDIPLGGPGLDYWTERNVFEHNTFTGIPDHGNGSPYSCMQYAGQRGMIRFNRFYNNAQTGFRFGLWEGSQSPPEAGRNTGNRLYHNVFYDCGHAAITMATEPGFEIDFSDNIVKNNILYQNNFVRYDWRANRDWYSIIHNENVQVIVCRLNGFRFEHNNIIHTDPNNQYAIAGWKWETSIYVDLISGDPHNSVAWWESNYSALFTDNLTLYPKFVNASGFNFNLQSTSLMIDAGAFLTKTVGTGNNSTILQVEDASYFHDGHDIPGEAGDVIKIEGQSKWARITDINYGSNVLTLDYPLTWSSGEGVSLFYLGSKPDLGAFEYGQ